MPEYLSIFSQHLTRNEATSIQSSQAQDIPLSEMDIEKRYPRDIPKICRKHIPKMSKLDMALDENLLHLMPALGDRQRSPRRWRPRARRLRVGLPRTAAAALLGRW